MKTEPSRVVRAVRSAGVVWHLQALVPADFLDCEGWPFSLVQIEGHESEAAKLRRKFSGPGFKDKRVLENEQREEELAFQVFFKGIKKPTVSRPGLGGRWDYSRIKACPELHGRLLAEIASLSYGCTLQEYARRYPLIIRREFADAIQALSRAHGAEPWTLYGAQGSAPALYNPMRWDFNLALTAYGIEREIEAIEEAKRKNKVR